MPKRIIDKKPDNNQEPFKPLTDREFYLTLINTYIKATFYIDDKLEEAHILKGMLATADRMEAHMIKRNLGHAASNSSEKIGVCEALASVINTFSKNRSVFAHTDSYQK